MFNLTPDQIVVLEALLASDLNGESPIQSQLNAFLRSLNQKGYILISITELNDKRRESYEAGWKVGNSIEREGVRS